MRFGAPLILITALFTLLLGGCAGLEEDRRNSNFGLQLLSYENAVRWGEYKLAASYIKPGLLTEPIDFDSYDGIEIADWKVRNTINSEDGNQTTLELRIHYMRKGEAQVRKIDRVQTWEYDKETKRWWLITPFPKFD
jgi:hypothetical protein